MASLKVIATTDGDFNAQWAALREKLSLTAVLSGDSDRLKQVRQIIEQVRRDKDNAVAQLTLEYDQVELTAAEFRLSKSAMKEAHQQMDPKLLEALRESIDNVRRYQEAIRISPPKDLVNNGVRLALRYRPIERIGVCVPGASAPLISTVIMTVVPAQTAGVKEIAIISAPRKQCNNSIHPSILGVCYELGVDEVYRISGAQGVAALGLGTQTIPKVDKIVGPGNAWVQLAKKELYGFVSIDQIAGPSEVLILADETAQANWVAADMLSQTEHDPGSALLLTDSKTLAQTVAKEIDQQLGTLDRGERTKKWIAETSAAIITRDMNEAVSLANDFAPEHLQIICNHSEQVAETIKHAGAIFVGPYTPVATGDYLAGPSHTLPTGGTAKSFSGLTVNDFLKTSSLIQYEQESLKQASSSITKLANAEGLDAHSRSIKIRNEPRP
ncbi:MAG: histidinol dehydrogenase [Planctomycetes bacterium]|nr:histidinol dehydrogenase [Planctomycetota bacterium]